MTSQFDALLSFGDDTPPTTNGTSQKASETDDFDPFGPGLSVEGKGGAGDSGLLLDFTVSTEVNNKTENGDADPFEAQFTVTTSADETRSSGDLLYDMSAADTESSSVNPLYDMSSTQSANPLYDLLDEDLASERQQQGGDSHSQNLLYDFSANNNGDFLIETDTTDTSASANPLYDLGEDEVQPEQQQREEEEEEETIQVAVTSQVEAAPKWGAGEEDFEAEAGGRYPDDEQVVPAEAEQGESTQDRYQYEEENDQHVELYIKEEGDDAMADAEVAVAAAAVGAAVDVTDAAGDDGDADSTKGRRRSRSRSPSRSRSISSEREVLNEEEEMRKDGRTVYRSHEEQSFSETRSDGHPPQQLIDSGFGSSSMMREDFSASGAGGLQNGEQARDPNVAREERQREDFHFTEMSSVKNQFERGAGPTPAPRRGLDVRAEVAAAEGGVYESQPTTFEPQWQEEVEEGVYENEPVQRPDVVKETDRNVAAELPAVGMARNIRERFQSGKVEASSTAAKREIIPAADAVDGGVFENQPKYNPDVVHSGEGVQEELPEQGTARNLAAKFKQMEKQGGVPSPATQGRRELTPDRTGRVEYVSEPRGYIEKYEGQSEAGVFESNPEERGDVVKSDYQLEEALPERGTAKNIAQQFRQLSTSGGSAARAKREITPDTSGRSEYVSEPREFVETYEGRAESGVFESQPVDRPDVVKSDQLTDEVLPERGAARNIAAKFREMESAMKSPPQSPSRRKEFTPPRDDTDRTVAGVVENTPTVSSDVVHSGEQVEEVMPERGTAKSMVNRFKQMGSGSSSAGQSPRPKKEFTPPPADSGVFENNPQEFVPDYNPPPESGIIESHPQQRTDVVRGDEPPNYEQELPERGSARSLVSAWRQRESENVKGSPTASAKLKEFTPPRDEPRVVQQRSACRTPKSPLTGGESLDEGSIQPSDLPDQYQRQEEASVYESQPERLEGVVSEQDTDWTEGLPKKDTTKKMLAKFKHIQAEASKESPRPVPSGRKEEEDNSSEPTPDKVVRSKSMRVAVQLEKCGACGKTVYAMEKIEIEKNAYHKACFRCSHCHCVLTPKTFAVNNHVMFCTTHYKQLFATKGNYDEGFGRDQHKKRWKSESNLAEDLQNKSPQ